MLDGTIIDDTYANTVYNTVLDSTTLIQGMVKGISMMKEGEQALLIIPSSLAYGKSYYGILIPPYSTLLFEVKLLDIY